MGELGQQPVTGCRPFSSQHRSATCDAQKEQARVDVDAVAIVIGERAADGRATNQHAERAVGAARRVILVRSGQRAAGEYQRRARIIVADTIHLRIDLGS